MCCIVNRGRRRRWALQPAEAGRLLSECPGHRRDRDSGTRRVAVHAIIAMSTRAWTLRPRRTIAARRSAHDRYRVVPAMNRGAIDGAGVRRAGTSSPDTHSRTARGTAACLSPDRPEAGSYSRSHRPPGPRRDPGPSVEVAAADRSHLNQARISPQTPRPGSSDFPIDIGHASRVAFSAAVSGQIVKDHV